MSQEHSITVSDLEGLINDELSRIKALAVSIIGVARDREELENLPYDVHPLDHLEELATLILVQQNKIRETLGDLELKMLKGEIQISTAGHEEIQ